MRDQLTHDEAMKTQRHMAWERAKGELRSMLHTYWPSWDRQNVKIPNGFEEFRAKVEAFIKDIEDEHM